jgi:hypothetical protein
MENEFKGKTEHVFKKIDPTKNENNFISQNLELVNKKKNKSKKRKKKEPKTCQFESCQTKLKFVKIQCKCNLYHCSKHRHKHNCTYDYKKNSKINKILIDGNSNFNKLDKI